MLALEARDGHALQHTHGEIADAILAALRDQGLVVVPRYATDAMTAHADKVMEMHGRPLHFADLWLAMVVAANPPPPEERKT